MDTATHERIRARRFKHAEYMRMREAGILTEDDSVGAHRGGVYRAGRGAVPGAADRQLRRVAAAGNQCHAATDHGVIRIRLDSLPNPYAQSVAPADRESCRGAGPTPVERIASVQNRCKNHRKGRFSLFANRNRSSNPGAVCEFT
jgi:hypothetical protein